LTRRLEADGSPLRRFGDKIAERPTGAEANAVGLTVLRLVFPIRQRRAATGGRRSRAPAIGDREVDGDVDRRGVGRRATPPARVRGHVSRSIGILYRPGSGRTRRARTRTRRARTRCARTTVDAGPARAAATRCRRSRVDPTGRAARPAHVRRAGVRGNGWGVAVRTAEAPPRHERQHQHGRKQSHGRGDALANTA
jgi:hypothetical protein